MEEDQLLYKAFLHFQTSLFIFCLNLTVNRFETLNSTLDSQESKKQKEQLSAPGSGRRAVLIVR